MTPPLVIDRVVIDRDLHDALMKDPLYARRLKIGIKIGRVIVKGENCMSDYEIMDGSPAGSHACKHKETGAATIVSTAENIFARTLEHEPPNDAHLHGRVRRCRVCRAETTNDRLCDACHAAGVRLHTCERCGQEFTAFGPEDALCLQCLEADALREERGAARAEMCRIHRVRYVDDLPVSVLEEMQRGRC